MHTVILRLDIKLHQDLSECGVMCQSDLSRLAMYFTIQTLRAPLRLERGAHKNYIKTNIQP